VDEELLNKLKHMQLVDLYQELAGWEPHPHLATYHISFLKNYLALLVHFSSIEPVRSLKKLIKHFLIGFVTRGLTQGGTSRVLVRKGMVNFTSMIGMLDT
jgi:hypothetical protein